MREEAHIVEVVVRRHRSCIFQGTRKNPTNCAEGLLPRRMEVECAEGTGLGDGESETGWEPQLAEREEELSGT